ncbi:MAG: AAA family ATPase [Clostridiaceae bacterium]|nr:AAA family ATPase [Clostridiaceae bacterium]
MRPEKLVISAFGPYAKEEVIDFNVLDGKNIFLITGPTGAGKTSIFDAISYALYGEASGSTRENDSLRSDFADANRLTFVELDFELRGELYHIKRMPQQLKPKVKGEGFTNQSAEAELIMPDGKVKTGANNVSNKIIELLGINKEQFKQIVMLPQGEFKKLLLADSKEREVIFRKIFGTQTFEQIQSLLNDRARALSKELEKSRDRVLANIRNIKSDEPIINDDYYDFNTVNNNIKKIIKDDKNKAKEIDKKLKEVRESIEKIQAQKIKDQNNNKLLDDKKDIEEKIKLLEAKKGEVIKNEEIVTKATNAKEIVYVESELLKLRNSEEVKIKDLKNIQDKIKQIKQELNEAKENFAKQEAREDEKNELIKSINLLNEKKPKIIEYDKKIREISSLKQKVKENECKIHNEEKSIDNIKKELKEKEELSKNILQLEKEKLKLEKQVEEKDNLIKEVRELYIVLIDYKKLLEKYDELTITFKNIEKEYKESKSDYENKEEIYMKEQAGILASGLEENVACPVCGSLEHPNPAKRLESVPTEEELKSSKKIFEDKQINYNNLLLELSNLKKNIETQLNEIINRKLKKLSQNICCAECYESGIIEVVLEQGKELGNELSLLSKKIEEIDKIIGKKSEISGRIDILNNKLNAKESILRDLRIIYTDEFGKQKAQEESIKTLEKEIPQEIRQLDVLNNRIKELELTVDKISKSIKESLDKVNYLTNLLSGENSKLKEIEKILEEVKENIKITTMTINDKIIKYNFANYDEYNLIKSFISEIDKITKEISIYKEQYKSLKDREFEINNKTMNLSRVNLDEYDEQIEKLRLEEEAITKEAKEIYSIISNNVSLLEDIKEIYVTVQQKEKRYSVIGELASLSNGQKSPYITFERFVLASYFQEIIDSANIRLSKMTGERYKLKRKEDKGKGRAQQGLELEVYDNYTGKCRHVKTLSGGESFKASLALALGLSDVVQANAGGISLDTIFIDEGFGTLDSESLENAINSLLELQKGGRLVGIISHVAELKERIESKLEIKITSEGSSIQFTTN